MERHFANFAQGDMSLERQSSEDMHDSTIADDAGLLDGDDFTDDNFESNLRRRKGKIISCAKETIENASRQLRRKVPYAGHLMTPRRLWLNKIPTQCDVVVEFPEDAPDEALRWLLARIRSQPPAGLGLVVQVKAHESNRRNAFYISAPTNILFKAAEEARLPKRLRPDLGGALREFTTRESHCFQQLKANDGSTALFTSQERQWLTLQVLQGLRAGQTDIGALHGRASVAEGQSIVAAWQESGLITQVFPLHETKALAHLQHTWVKQIFAPQPLDDIAEYFGVKVALYFAWLGHYTCALGVPAVLGTILYCFLWGKGQMAQDMGHVLFSLFNVVWASLYLEAWKRYSAELAFRWGTLSTPPELLEPPRPLYKGPLVENNVTGRLEPREAPPWKRRAFRYLVSFPIIGLCLLLVFAVMFLMLRFQDWLDHNHIPDRGIAQCMYNLHKDWWDSKLPEESILCCLSVIPKVLLAGAITLMDEAYFKLAVWLNDRENYRLQSKYENHLIAKVALFQFVNSFLSLFYIAFYLRDEEKLKEQLAGLLISRQIIGNLRESAVPYVLEQWKLARLSFTMWGALSPTQDVNRTILGGSAEQSEQTAKEAATKNGHEMISPPNSGATNSSSNAKRNIGQAEIESSLYKYDGTFSDHLEMLVQMGYVVLFSAAFPLAGVCALINNLMEIRSDAFKLAHVHQRPFGQRVANIGTWQNALSALSLAAVIVNCALIGLSGQVSRLWPGLTTAQTIILIVLLEHAMLGLRSALHWLLPELPSWLAAEIARAEHCRREMQCKGSSPRPTPPTPPSAAFTQSEQEGLNQIECASTNELSMDSQIADDFYHDHQHPAYGYHYSSCGDEIAQFGLQRGSIEADVNVFESRDSTPDSPPSQTSTILIRPLHESTPPQGGASLTSLHQDGGHGHDTTSAATNSASTLALMTRPVMHIPEIPPFRKKSNESVEQVVSSASSSPARPSVSTPPPHQAHFPSLQQQHSYPHQHQQQQQQQPQQQPQQVGGKISDKPRKISVESAIHLQMSELQSSNAEVSNILKPAPSWSNVAVKSQRHAGARTSVSGISTSSSSEKEQQPPAATGSAPNATEKSTTSTSTSTAAKSSNASNASNAEDEVKAAELAAKKSRLKQKLVKSARSVAIFSLKLKERRQREAEKAANIAVEHAKALARLPLMPQPGGELSLIPIEQLIQIEDIRQPIPKPMATATASAATTATATGTATATASSSTSMSATAPTSSSSGQQQYSTNH